MKKSTKTILLIGTVLLAAGIILSLISIAIGVNNPNFLNESDFVVKNTKEWAITEIESIELDADVHNISFVVGDSDTVKVNTSDRKHSETNVDVKNSVLTIKSQWNKKSFFSLPFFSFDFAYKIVVELPKSFNGDIQVESRTGAVSMEDLEELKDVAIKTTTGRIALNNTKMNELDLKATTGRIELNEIIAKGDANVVATTGRIDGVNIQTKDINVKVTTGRTSIDSLTAENITLKSTTGRIEATIVGNEDDYDIDASTTTGKCVAPTGNNKATKEITASTTTGGLDIDFLD